MYGPIKSAALALLKVPLGPPEPPAGSHASVRVFRASPRFLQYRMIVLALVFGVIFLGVIFLCVAGGAAGALLGLGPLGLAIALPLFALYFGFLLLAVLVTRIDFDLRYYIVTDRSLRVRSGAWTVKEMTLTYANVQNLRVVQGPIERLFGISNVAVDTAGKSVVAGPHGTSSTVSHHVDLAGIDNAAEVRDLILGYLRARPSGSGLGDPDDEAQRAPHARVASPELAGALRGVRDAARALRAAAEAP